jgi:hypothetical protein
VQREKAGTRQAREPDQHHAGVGTPPPRLAHQQAETGSDDPVDEDEPEVRRFAVPAAIEAVREAQDDEGPERQREYSKPSNRLTPSCVGLETR